MGEEGNEREEISLTYHLRMKAALQLALEMTITITYLLPKG